MNRDMTTIDEKAMNGADLKRFAALVKKTASQSAHGMMSKTDKSKLDGIAAGAEVNVQADWNVTDTNSDAFIKNKPTIDSALSSTSTNAVQNKVVATEVNKKVNTEDLASSASGKGAGLVGYSTKTDGGTTTNVTVKDALDKIYESIGDGGDLDTRVTALEEGKQDKLTQGTNITISNNTISAKDEKVNQTVSTENADIPMLLANGATPSNGGVQYDTDLKYNPVTNTLSIGLGTLTGTNYSGTASRATSDGAGNNIASTYATKEEAMSQHPTIVTSLPTADGTHSGLYFVRNASSSTPTKNVYDEYIEVNTGTDSSPLWVWEEIGSTDVTLNVAYLTTSEVQQIWESTEWT